MNDMIIDNSYNNNYSLGTSDTSGTSNTSLTLSEHSQKSGTHLMLSMGNPRVLLLYQDGCRRIEWIVEVLSKQFSPDKITLCVGEYIMTDDQKEIFEQIFKDNTITYHQFPTSSGYDRVVAFNTHYNPVKYTFIGVGVELCESLLSCTGEEYDTIIRKTRELDVSLFECSVQTIIKLCNELHLDYNAWDEKEQLCVTNSQFFFLQQNIKRMQLQSYTPCFPEFTDKYVYPIVHGRVDTQISKVHKDLMLYPNWSYIISQKPLYLQKFPPFSQLIRTFDEDKIIHVFGRSIVCAKEFEMCTIKIGKGNTFWLFTKEDTVVCMT